MLPVATLRRRLLGWYWREARDLPWRRTRDAWAVWVSEVMLQQTQVATVLPYYERFLDRFPTVRDLARAREATVLHAWAGLGYYRRARMLRAAAAEVVREHAGRVPDDPETFGRLPGVGRYTCGAVMSIAYGQPLPVLDGNVARVLARLTARPLVVRVPRDARVLWDLAAALVPMRSPGDWNQAMMELGARVCTPRSPDCGACPVNALCRAYALGRSEAFPPPSPRRATVTLRRALALVERRGRLLMVRREGALLAGLWEPPGVDRVDDEPPEVTRLALATTLRRLDARAVLTPLAAVVRHAITHRAYQVTLWAGPLEGAAPRGSSHRWVDPAAPGLALTALAVKSVRAWRRERGEAAGRTRATRAARPGSGSASNAERRRPGHPERRRRV